MCRSVELGVAVDRSAADLDISGVVFEWSVVSFAMSGVVDKSVADFAVLVLRYKERLIGVRGS